jgi:hypothetical protein
MYTYFQTKIEILLRKRSQKRLFPGHHPCKKYLGMELGEITIAMEKFQCTFLMWHENNKVQLL